MPQAACAGRSWRSSATSGTPFERAAAVFGPQKGADPEAIARLEARLDELARRPSGATPVGCR